MDQPQQVILAMASDKGYNEKHVSYLYWFVGLHCEVNHWEEFTSELDSHMLHIFMVLLPINIYIYVTYMYMCCSCYSKLVEKWTESGQFHHFGGKQWDHFK